MELSSANPQHGRWLSAGMGRFNALLVLVGVAAIFEIVGWLNLGQSFLLNDQRLFIMVLQMSIIGVMALGVTQIMIMGGIDLSGGSILGLAGLVAASLAQSSLASSPVYPALIDLPLVVPVLAGLAAATALGLANGILCGLTKAPPFIITLGMMVFARGIAHGYTDGAQVSFFTAGFSVFGRGANPVLIFAGVALICHVLLRRTLYGRHTYAIGSNEAAARMAGINVAGHKMLVYALAGFLYGLAAITQTSRAETAQTSTGLNWELDAIAAVVIGGTSLRGGVGSVAGTVIGVLILGVMTSGFTFLQVDAYYINLVKGVLVVATVVADQYRNASRKRRA